MKPPTNNRITQGQHLTSKAVDHSASPDPFVYAPEDGTIDSYAFRGVGTNSAGNVLRLKGDTGMHSFCHLEESYVAVGSTVKQGQKLAKMGHTGFTIPAGPLGTHLHYYILTPNGYVYPPSLYKGKQEINMATIIGPEHTGILRIAHSEIGGWNIHEVHAGLHDAKFHAAWDGKTVDELIWAQWDEKTAEAYRNSREANKTKIVELTKALASEKAKPPKEVIKEVEKIVEKPVEVIKIEQVPVEVITEVEKPLSWRRVIDWVLSKFKK